MKKRKVTVRLMGGLGNQMFQYAYGYSLMDRFDVSFEKSYFSESNSRQYLLNIFNITPSISQKTTDLFADKSLSAKIFRKSMRIIRHIRKEDISYGYDASAVITPGRIMEGYFQDERYFIEKSADIKNEFAFDVEIDGGLKKMVQLLEDMKTSVSVHFRRGDYLMNIKMYGNICTDEYYRKAIEYIKQYTSPYFVVFSDDIEWAKMIFPEENALFISKDDFESYQDWYDLCLMSHCRHNIIANSSFSWWGAWLNEHAEKIVLCPRLWENENINRKMRCENWIEI